MIRRLVVFSVTGAVVSAAVLFCTTTVRAQRTGAASDSTAASPTLIAVRTTAEWCKVCQSTKAEFAAAARRPSFEPVLFVTLDYTDPYSSRQAGYLAAALGIRDAIPTNGTRVGELHLIDAATKALVSTISLNRIAENMPSAVDAALRTAR